MRRLLTILSLMTALLCSAQTVQHGVVQEYNEKSKKTPLGGVELNVRSAGATISDDKGGFILRFLTLAPGAKVNVRRIEKLGYEIFNKEAVEQWNINPSDPFTIVMCRSDRFKTIRDNYERVSSESYARQFRREEKNLEKLKNEGSIKESEYQKQLAELREHYESQLDNLDSYVDRFARIDLSELSAAEQQIIELVQQGRIDEAIAKYDSQNYVDKYAREVTQLRDVTSAISQLSDVKQTKEQTRDRLFDAIKRQVETLQLAGGKENLLKAKGILKDVVTTDPANSKAMLLYGGFLFEQNFLDEADSVLSAIVDRPDLTVLDRANSLYRLGTVKRLRHDLPASIELLKRGLECIHPDDGTVMAGEIDFLRSLYASYSTHGEIENAHTTILTAKLKMDSIVVDDGNVALPRHTIGVLNSLGLSYQTFGEYEKALECFVRGSELYHQTFDTPDFVSNNVDNNLAELHMLLGNYDKADSILTEYIAHVEKISAGQPMKYADVISNAYNSRLLLYQESKDFDKAEAAAYKAIAALDNFKNITGISPDFNYSTVYNNLAIVLSQKGDQAGELKYMMAALDCLRNIKARGDNDYDLNMAMLCNNIAVTHALLGNESDFGRYMSDALNILTDYHTPDLEKQIKRSTCYFNIGEIYRTLFNDYDEARKYYGIALDVIRNVDPDFSRSRADAAKIYYSVAASHLFEGDGEKALEFIDVALQITPDDIHILDGKGEILCNMGRTDDALEVWRRICAINPTVDPAEVYMHRLLFPEKYVEAGSGQADEIAD